MNKEVTVGIDWIKASPVEGRSAEADGCDDHYDCEDDDDGPPPPCGTPPIVPNFLLPPDRVIITQPTPETEFSPSLLDEHHQNNEDQDEEDIQGKQSLAGSCFF